MINNNEWSMCRYCTYYEELEGCEYSCLSKSGWKPANSRIIEKAKEKGISVTDFIELLRLNNLEMKRWMGK